MIKTSKFQFEKNDDTYSVDLYDFSKSIETLKKEVAGEVEVVIVSRNDDEPKSIEGIEFDWALGTITIVTE